MRNDQFVVFSKCLCTVQRLFTEPCSYQLKLKIMNSIAKPQHDTQHGAESSGICKVLFCFRAPDGLGFQTGKIPQMPASFDNHMDYFDYILL